jgi:hypothetical protein
VLSPGRESGIPRGWDVGEWQLMVEQTMNLEAQTIDRMGAHKILGHRSSAGDLQIVFDS